MMAQNDTRTRFLDLGEDRASKSIMQNECIVNIGPITKARKE